MKDDYIENLKKEMRTTEEKLKTLKEALQEEERERSKEFAKQKEESLEKIKRLSKELEEEIDYHTKKFGTIEIKGTEDVYPLYNFFERLMKTAWF